MEIDVGRRGEVTNHEMWRRGLLPQATQNGIAHVFNIEVEHARFDPEDQGAWMRNIVGMSFKIREPVRAWDLAEKRDVWMSGTAQQLDKRDNRPNQHSSQEA